MPRRTICIQNTAKISIESSSLKVESSSGILSIPLEDIWVLILETHSAQISSRALASLAENGIGVMSCGRNHMPNGLFLPIGAHSRHAEIVKHQLSMPKPLCKQLWKRIVVRKILNQAFVLKSNALPSSNRLETEARKVTSGDTTNREAVAAAEYFKHLIPEGTRRSSTMGTCLDYAYAVLRAGIARAAVSDGWLVSRGIHHSNNLNAFNLVDDLLEPYRPVADLLVSQTLPNYQLNPNNKGVLASIFEYSVVIRGKQYTVQSSIDRMLDSLRHAVLEKDADLLELPEIVDLKRFDGEDR